MADQQKAIHAAIPSAPENGIGANGSQMSNYAVMRKFILSHLPDGHVSAFNAQLAEAAALACDSGSLLGMREMPENWEATAEIYAVPGQAETIIAAITEDEATRDERRTQGEWDWQIEQQMFLRSLSQSGTPSGA